MYLSRLIVKNFRSINFVDINFTKGKNVVVGRNNAGKSNIIKAIDLALGESSPTYEKLENIKETDFYTWKEKNGEGKEVIKSANEIIIYCELRREPEDQLNWELIKNALGTYIKVDPIEFDIPYNNPTIFTKIVKTIFSIEFEKLRSLTKNSPGEKTFLSPKKNFQNVKRYLENSYRFIYLFIACKDENEIFKLMRFLLHVSDSKWIIAERPFIRTELLQSAIIPSFRDPSMQLRITQWSWYGKLMKHLINEHIKTKEQELQSTLNQLQNISNEIFQKIKEEITTSSLNVAFPGTEIYFQFGEDLKPDLHKNVVIHIDDGFKSNLFEKGAGIQSATIIGLFSYYVKHVNTKTSALLCIEEPELYLHPHACRVISDRLDEFIGDTNQVIITTHSPEFIRTTRENFNIILVKKIKNETQAFSVDIKEFKSVLFDNNQTEIFFADKVIICEGYDGYILKLIGGKQLHEKNVSVISVGGKDNISKFVKLALKLGLDVYILADFDYLLRDKEKEREKYKINGNNIPAHESVIDLPLEKMLGEEGSSVRSKVVKLRKKIKEKYEEKFYTSKRINDFQDDSQAVKKIKEILELLYNYGIYILDGEIEDYVKDKSILENGKITLNSIFKINQLLANGKEIENIFEIEEFNRFLENVLSD